MFHYGYNQLPKMNLFSIIGNNLYQRLLPKNILFFGLNFRKIILKNQEVLCGKAGEGRKRKQFFQSFHTTHIELQTDTSNRLPLTFIPIKRPDN